MDLVPETNIPEIRQHKPFMEIQNLLGKEYIYKRTSIGTKVFATNNEKFENCKVRCSCLINLINFKND